MAERDPALEMDETRAREIFARALEANRRQARPAEDLELTLQAAHASLTRFANNAITQNVAERQVALSARAVWEGRTARASTNRLDAEGVRAVVERALELTRLQQPDPELLPMLGPQKYGAADREFAATAALTPRDRAEAVRGMVAVAEESGLTTAGTAANNHTFYALLNSRGLEAFHRETGAEYSVTMLAPDSSGWAKGNAPDAKALDPTAGARRAAEKARASAHPREMPPGRYTVILEPAAVLDLLGFLFWDFGGLSVLDQRSCLTGRVGADLFGANITVHDDVFHPLQSGAPFDGEGAPRQRVELVNRGVVSGLVYARATAARMNREKPEIAARPTGHGFPLPNEYGEAPMNLVISGGETSLEQMIAAADKAILVTRLWYIREVDPYKKILTGMTRDGTFLVSGGEIAHGVRNFRFNQSVIEMLRRVTALGPAARTSGEESFDMVTPPMMVQDFNFTEVTKF